MLTALSLSQILLSTAPIGPTQLTLDVQPAGVEIQVDGKRAGSSGKPVQIKLKPGRHVVRMTFKGDSHEEEVSMRAGEKKTFQFAFNHAKPSNLEDPDTSLEQ